MKNMLEFFIKVRRGKCLQYVVMALDNDAYNLGHFPEELFFSMLECEF